MSRQSTVLEVQNVKMPLAVGGARDNHPEEVEHNSTKSNSVDDGVPVSPTESQDESHPELNMGPTVSRRCPITHKPHSYLTSFNVNTCPACGQDIFSTKNPDSNVAPEGEYRSSSESDYDRYIRRRRRRPDSVSEFDDDEGTAGLEGGMIKHTLTFLDQSARSFRVIPWPVPFDLQKERTNYKTSDLAFEIITSLQTLLAEGDAYERQSRRGRAIVTVTAGRDMLDDPSLDVAVRRISVLVHSKALIEIIKHVVSYYPGVNLDVKPVRLAEPFAIIVHHLPQLEGILRSSDALDVVSVSQSWTEETKQLVHQQLDSFLQFFKQPSYTSLIEEEVERNARGYCTFRMLWYILRPGSTVYLSREGRLDAHIIAKATVDKRILRPGVSSPKPYEISLWHLDFDGRHIGRCAVFVSIPAFEGERSITSLKIFPVEYRDNVDGWKTRRDIEDLGEQWFKYLLGAQAHYKGEFMGPMGRQV